MAKIEISLFPNEWGAVLEALRQHGDRELAQQIGGYINAHLPQPTQSSTDGGSKEVGQNGNGNNQPIRPADGVQLEDGIPVSDDKKGALEVGSP